MMYGNPPSELSLADFRYAHTLALRKRLDFMPRERLEQMLAATIHTVQRDAVLAVESLLHGEMTPSLIDGVRLKLCYNLWLAEAYIIERQRRRDPRHSLDPRFAPPVTPLEKRLAAARRLDCVRLLRAVSDRGGIGVGLMHICRCPFHRDDDLSLWANTKEGGWFCLSCGREGDAITLMMELLGLEEMSALRLLELGILTRGWPKKPFYPEDIESPPAAGAAASAAVVTETPPPVPARLLALPERVEDAA